MIRLATKDDLLSITQLVKEAKQIMEEFNNNQWDDEYPAKEHFEEDIENKTLYVLDVDHTIYGFIVIDQNQSGGMMTLIGLLIEMEHTLFTD